MVNETAFASGPRKSVLENIVLIVDELEGEKVCVLKRKTQAHGLACQFADI